MKKVFSDNNATERLEDESCYVLTRLFEYLNDENEELRTAAVEGFCKLLYTDSITDIEVSILHSFILKFIHSYSFCASFQ
jgi:hypothetical protein